MTPPTAAQVYGLCPPGSNPVSRPSTRLTGRAFGIYLGGIYRTIPIHRPKSYCAVDFDVFRGLSYLGSLHVLQTLDPPVWGALATSERTRGFLASVERVDILDADRSEVYEIKPVRSRAEGVPQLAGYLQELNTLAGQTSTGTPRSWKGGSWDPSPYPLVIGNALSGHITILHAWRDPKVTGLLLYDIVECARKDDDPDLEHVLGIPVIDDWSEYLAPVKAPIQEMILAVLPKAPVGTKYAVIVPWRFFEAFVLPKLKLDADLRARGFYEVRVNPVHVQRLLAGWAALQAFGGAPLTSAAFVDSGWMDTEQFRRLYKNEALAQLTGTAVAGVGLAAVPVTADLVAQAAVADVVVDSGAAEVTSAAAMDTAALPADEVLAAQSAAPDLLPTWINGVQPLVNLAVPAAPAAIPAAAAAAAGSIPADLGMVGAFLVGMFGTTAQAALQQTGDGQVVPTPVGTDGIHVVPVDTLTSRSGEVRVHAKVEHAGATFGVIGIVHAKAAP